MCMDTYSGLLQLSINYGLAIVLTIWLTKYILDNISSKLERIADELQKVERELTVVLDYIKLNIADRCKYGADGDKDDRSE